MPRDVVLFVLGVVLTAVVSEFTEISPWLARRLVGPAARAWTDDVMLQRIYSEEWLAVVEERPGKLFKLLTALSFYGSAVLALAGRRIGRLLATHGVQAGRWLWRWTLATWPQVAWTGAYTLTSFAVASLFKVNLAIGMAAASVAFLVGGLAMSLVQRWRRSRRSQSRRQPDR